MGIQASMTIGELAATTPRSISVLHRRHIDYCCKGGRSIAAACEAAGITVDELIREIENAPAPVTAERDWTSASLASLQNFIVDTHHVYTREALDTLMKLAKKVAGVHGTNHPELIEVAGVVYEMAQDLLPHMLKEEQVLFPYIERMEAATLADQQPPVPFFGTVRNPISMMLGEHEAVGTLLVKLRVLTRDYQLPGDACLSYRALFEKLVEIEQDLHRHIHIENNVLFVRAAAMEQQSRPDAPEFAAGGCHGSSCGH